MNRLGIIIPALFVLLTSLVGVKQFGFWEVVLVPLALLTFAFDIKRFTLLRLTISMVIAMVIVAVAVWVTARYHP